MTIDELIEQLNDIKNINPIAGRSKIYVENELSEDFLLFKIEHLDSYNLTYLHFNGI